MKVKYLGTLFAASLLSLGLITSCATPEAGETEIDTDTEVVEPDTDAEIIEPDTDVEVEEVDPEED